MGPFAKGEIVLFPFPYSDLSSRKLRPCIVLSTIQPDILLCQITSQNITSNEYSVFITDKDLSQGTLHVPSHIRTNRLFTAYSPQIVRSIGKISTNKYKEVVEKIQELIE